MLNVNDPRNPRNDQISKVYKNPDEIFSISQSGLY